MSVTMADDGYSSSPWEATDNSASGYSMYGAVGDSLYTDPPPAHSYANLSSQPRSSADSSGGPATSKWGDSVNAPERRETLSTPPTDAASLVETTFDENILRALCDLDVS
jgi:Rho GTPase-activating protein RGD1